MRRAVHGIDVIERMLRLGARVGRGEKMTARKIMALYNVSWSTAKRDIVRLAIVFPQEGA